MITVRQLNVGGFDSNFSYLVVDDASGDAVIVDPCGDTGVIRSAVDKVPNLIPRFILLTHGHDDHTSGVCEVRKFFNAPVAGHPECMFKIDKPLQDHEQIPFGMTFIECLYAPGHTADSVIYRLGDDSGVFTGDTLFIDWCGYCNAGTMFSTMQNVVFPLADSNIVYSGHDYGHAPCAPLGAEKLGNPYLAAKSFDEFKNALENL